MGDSCRKKAFGGGMPPGPRQTKRRSSNFKVEEKMPKAEGAKGGKCKKKRSESYSIYIYKVSPRSPTRPTIHNPGKFGAVAEGVRGVLLY